MTYEETIKAISRLYNDDSFTVEEALQNMNGLRDEIAVFIEGLEADMDGKEDDDTLYQAMNDMRPLD